MMIPKKSEISVLCGHRQVMANVYLSW